jgi:acyl dehydratase
MAEPHGAVPMMAAELAPGRAGRSYWMPIEQGKVREFAWATKAADTRYWSDPAPFLPPTFLVSNAFWLQPGSWVLDNAGLDWARLLSGGSEFTFDGPPLRAGEQLTATQRVDDVYRKRGRRGGDMTFVVFTTSYARPDGTVAARERHTTIQTEQAPDPAAPSPQADADGSRPAAPVSPGHEQPVAPAPSRPGEVPGGPASLQLGDRLPLLVDAPTSVTDIVRYQGASGDMNPIHHDPGFAQLAGFPGVFSVGMLQAGILGSYLGDLFGAERIRRFGVQFREQVWPGDVLTYGGDITGRRPVADGSAIELDLSLTGRRHRGGEHVRATATVVANLP